jgi:hypothetical protein
VLTDLVVEMLDIAARRARAQGLADIETRVCNADDLPSQFEHLRTSCSSRSPAGKGLRAPAALWRGDAVSQPSPFLVGRSGSPA